MQFCDACGSMMRKENDVMQCTVCGQTAEHAHDSDAFVSTQEQAGDELIETSADASFEGKPTDDSVHCDDCGNDTAWYTIKQTASADEPPTRFFKCTECGYRWREYS